MLCLPDTGAQILADGRRIVPSAQRNVAAILNVTQDYHLQGKLLEIASGSGLHAGQIAPHFPDLIWQPTDLDPSNFASIRAWTKGVGTVAPPLRVDATQSGWGAHFTPQDAILLINLLHLIPDSAAEILLNQLPLAPKGRAFLYGPFLRDGATTSDGDAAFHASLRSQDPRLGYKDLKWICDLLKHGGATLTLREMPANNLMIIAEGP
jgi:hypothetical protein